MNPQTNIHLNATGIGNKDSFNVTNSYNNTVNTYRYVDEKPQVLEWLSPLEPRVRHQDVRTNRADGVGEWLLRSDEFVNWRDGKSGSGGAILFCSGAPGVGKTYLSSLVIDTLCDQSVGEKVAVACFYCDFQYQKTQTPENILGALIKQLMRGLGAIPTEINNAFRKAKGQVGGRGLRVHELLPLLQAALASLERAFICIDALDECLEKHRPELLRSLCTVSQRSPKIRFFITGRPHIHREIEKHFHGGAQFIKIKPTIDDIMKYLQMMLDNDPEPEAMNADLKAEIVKRVSETISDVFLLVSLNITAVLAETTIYDRREQLKRMTNGLGLGDAYRVALDRMEAQGGAKSKLGMAALMWISRSEVPMTVNELCHALGVRIGSTDLNPESIPSVQTLLASCHGLATVDKVGSTVRLVHLTLQEYLDSHSEIFRNPYSRMAEVCLTYLNYDCVKKLSPALDFAPPTTPLLEYASKCWGPYSRTETTECVKSLALPLLTIFDSHISAKLFLCSQVDQLIEAPGSEPEGFTGLHCVAYLGLNEIASALLRMKAGDINRTDFLGRTPLIWAARNGHEDIIKLFLKQKDINFNTKDAQSRRTALSLAAEGGYEKIVKLLLDQEAADAESRDSSGRTPLSYAAESGKEGTVKLFLEREEVNAESQDKSGRTPLSYVAGNGNEGAVTLLLERDEVNAESQDQGGRTPLSYAAEAGNEGAVKLFLELKEVNPESRDNNGRTPLSWAAKSGDQGTVKLFLEREDVNTESRDNDGRTPLSWAAESGNEKAVNLFLEREEVNAESQDKGGRTPLSYAAESGDERAVNLFLERKEVNAESRDNDGRTPLSWAAKSGEKGAVKLFLEREEVNAESRDNDGRTPLSYAAESWGSKKAVKLFLERQGVNAESRDNGGRAPLSYAAESGNEGAVKLLLKREEVDAESRDHDGRTPLSWAAQSVDEEAVKLFLERLDLSAEWQDNYGMTPLSHAASCGNEGAVKLFLERTEINAESRDSDGRTPLSHAAEWGCVGPVKLFLERAEVNAESQDNGGMTPLAYAAEGGNLGAVKLLLQQREVNAESRDNNGRTPLSHAAESGSIEVVKLFLEQIEVNAESRDNSDRTPLSYAACCGPPGVVELFLEREEVNVESRDEGGRTPLSWAAESGDEEMVKLFLKRKEVNAESQDYDGRTPLSYAAEWGSVETVKLFLERAEVNAKSRDNDGMTPLSYASEGGNEGVVELFLQWEEVNTESRDNHGRVPLLCSSRNGSEEPGAVNPRSRTLLGNEEVARLSQEHLDAMPIIQYHDARVPNACTNKSDLEEESLVQFPPHQGPTPKHSAPPPTHPVPPEAATVGSLEPSPQPPRRRFSLAFEDEPSAHITPKRRTPS